MQESDATTISSMDVTSKTNKEWRNPQPLDKEKEGKNFYDPLYMDPRFFSRGFRQVTSIVLKY